MKIAGSLTSNMHHQGDFMITSILHAPGRLRYMIHVFTYSPCPTPLSTSCPIVNFVLYSQSMFKPSNLDVVLFSPKFYQSYALSIVPDSSSVNPPNTVAVKFEKVCTTIKCVVCTLLSCKTTCPTCTRTVNSNKGLLCWLCTKLIVSACYLNCLIHQSPTVNLSEPYVLYVAMSLNDIAYRPLPQQWQHPSLFCSGSQNCLPTFSASQRMEGDLTTSPSQHINGPIGCIWILTGHMSLWGPFFKTAQPTDNWLELNSISRTPSFSHNICSKVLVFCHHWTDIRTHTHAHNAQYIPPCFLYVVTQNHVSICII